jgi:hypothetical protein
MALVGPEMKMKTKTLMEEDFLHHVALRLADCDLQVATRH